MSRIEGKLHAAGEAAIEPAELMEALRVRVPGRPEDRSMAIACYLSASEGWRDAGGVLGGAFATGSAEPPHEEAGQVLGLSGSKDA